MWISVFAVTIAISIGCVVTAIVIKISRVSGGCLCVPQPAFFRRVPGRAKGLLAAASFTFLLGIGSSISPCPGIRFRPFFEGAAGRQLLTGAFLRC